MDAASVAPLIGGVLIAVEIGVRIVAICVVPINRRPSTALAWLLAILLIPYVGIILFLLFGSAKLPKKRRVKQRAINARVMDITSGVEDVSDGIDHTDYLQNVVALNRRLGAMPLVGGNKAQLFPHYAESLAAMTEAIGTATKYVHVEFYIVSWDGATSDFFDALEAAVKRGIAVKVLLDHIASVRSPHYRRTVHKLEAIGVRWQLMLPVRPWRGQYQRPDLRNHRKIVIIDGRIGFTGSQNLVDRSYNKKGNIRRNLAWKDLIVRFEGPIVAGIDALFVTDWYSETDELLEKEIETDMSSTLQNALDAQVVPSGPGFDGENNLRLFNALLYNAEKRVIITSPYFVPDDSMLYSITTAAQRGLDVQLFASEVADQPVVYHAQRSYYEQLMRAGVRIWLYKAPTVLHAKHFTIDDDLAVIGSSNMDMRSFTLNLEISVMVHGRSFVSRLREVEESYRVESRELTLDEWLTRPLRSKVLDNVARLTAAVQ